MELRCQDYRIDGSDGEAEIVIDETSYDYDYWQKRRLSRKGAAYMESGRQFYRSLLDFDGMMLHASATVINGETYLFSGHCGFGKSTHAELLKKNYPGAMLINDDKPALRCLDGRWMAYGTPWCGKNGININAGYPLKAICLLTERRDRNEIRAAEPLNVISRLIAYSTGRTSRETAHKLSANIDRLIRDIPVYEMDSLADDEAARMAYNTMKNGMKV